MNEAQAILRPAPFQGFSQAILRLVGWQIIGRFPDEPKYIVIGAPHTSNLDFFFMLFLKGATSLDLHWIGKSSLFRKPLGTIMRKLGGIPVNRRSQNNFVAQIVQLFQSKDQMIIAISPEGTRSKAKYWRSGFYYMALGAQVPVVLVSIDYPSRSLEIGPMLQPSGDIESDFMVIRKFYSGKLGKYPKEQGEIQTRHLL